MSYKRKGQLTTSGEWAKHLRGFLKRQFWKKERSMAKSVIRDELKDTSVLNYKDHKVFQSNESIIKGYQLKKIGSDSENWRTFYITDDSNWIEFYPYGEYHGGGQPYIIRIGSLDTDLWIKENGDFENEIRKIIEKK